MFPYQTTVGEREVHSRDGLDHILHAMEHQWFVVWRGKRRIPAFRTRRLARINIRGLKKLRPGTQLQFSFA